MNRSIYLNFRVSFIVVVLIGFTNLLGCGGEATSNSTSDSQQEKREISKPGILFFGDSLTAGLGLVDPEETAWPSLIGKRLQEEGLEYEIWNAGLSGDTTSGGLGRLDYSLKREPAVFVLELGANDSMRGVPISEIRKNLILIIDLVQEKYPNTKILLVGIKTFPNLGASYRKQFDSLFPDIAKQKGVPLVPFLLEGIAGDRKLNQKDGIHPTEEGHEIIAETVYPHLKKLL
ncbi:MAG: arylesterase [Leptospira sp.]|nr:arylesterase [Leptospira sp.]